MDTRHLAVYLNDHLAGATSAIELMRHFEDAHEDHPAAAVVTRVRREVETEREELRGLIARLRVGESKPRQAAAWLGERMARLKLRVDDPADGALRVFESLEALCLGVQGKAALWRALSAAAPAAPELQGPDYDGLIARTQEQFESLESARRGMAQAALTPDRL